MSRSVFNRSRRGSVSLDFAAVAATLVIALIACIDLGRYVATRTALRAAVGEVARAAMTDTAITGAETPKALALSRVSLLAAEQLSIQVNRAATSVTVQASYNFSFISPFFGTAKDRTLAATVTTPI
jgi:Flp pilus assembly protein TadG